MPEINPYEKTKKNSGICFVPGLGAIEDQDPMTIIGMIRNGLPGSVLGDVAHAYQISKTDMYGLLDMSAKTGQRKTTQKLDKDTSDHLVQLVKVLCRATKIFDNHDKAMNWLKSPCFALGDQIPVGLLDTTEGTELVMDTLGRIEYGVFA